MMINMNRNIDNSRIWKEREDAIETARRAVRYLHNEALIKSISQNRQSKVMGVQSHAITARYRKGDMELSKFFGLADMLGVSPESVIDFARQSKTPSPAATGNGTDSGR